MTSHLSNYLRAYRKRAGLSQKDVAFLLGSRFHTKVSRFESFTREPNLRTALAFEVILSKRVSDLFAGICEQIEHDIAERAQILLRQLTADNTNARKLAALRSVAELEGDLRWEPIPLSAISKIDGAAFTKLDGRVTFPVSVSRRV